MQIPEGTICMNYQTLLLENKKENYTNLSSADFFFRREL